MNVELTLKNCRLAFADSMTEARSVAGGAERYSVVLIIEDDATLKQVRDAMDQIAKEEFGGKAPEGPNSCFRDGNKNVSQKSGTVYEGFANKFYLSANRAFKQGPPLVLSNRKDPDTGKPKILTDKRSESWPVSGDYVNAKVTLFTLNGANDRKNARTTAFGRKVCCELSAVQYWKKGERFGASAPSPEGLDTLPEEEDSEMGALA